MPFPRFPLACTFALVALAACQGAPVPAPSPPPAAASPSPTALPPATPSATPTPAPTPVGYRRPNVPGLTLTAAQLPPGFFPPGRGAVVDAEGGLWWVTDQGAAEWVHVDADGHEVGRWPVQAASSDAVFGQYLGVPGFGVVSVDVRRPDPGDLPTESTLAFTPLAGTPWSLSVVGGVSSLHLSPDRKHLWFHTSATSFKHHDGTLSAVTMDGEPALRLPLPDTSVVGIRPDGRAVAFSNTRISLIAPDGTIREAGPCSCFPTMDTIFPRLDPDGTAWWQGAGKAWQRLVPDAFEPTASGPPPSPAPEPRGGLTTADGTRWVPYNGPYPGTQGATLLGTAPGRPELQANFPYFEAVAPLGAAAGGKLWLQGTYLGRTYYGAVVPAAGRIGPERGPVEVPSFPPATPDLPGLWQVVPEDAPAGAFDGNCPAEGAYPAYRFEAAGGGIRVSEHAPVKPDPAPVAVEGGLVTFPAPPGLGGFAAMTLRYDAITGHLVGRDANGRPARLAKSPTGKNCAGGD